MRCLALLIFLGLPYLAINAQECGVLVAEKEANQNEVKKLTALKAANLKAYEQYQNDFSKKTKIFSNIMIITNKIEYLKSSEESFAEKFKKAGCAK